MFFFPKSPIFFDQFIILSSIIVQAGKLLTTIELKKPASLKKTAIAARKLESKADKIVHAVRLDASSTFITPIDREDILILITQLNAIVDHVENITTGIELFNLKTNGKEFSQFAGLVEKTTKQVNILIIALEKRDGQNEKLHEAVKKIHQLEKEGDLLMRQALAHLFRSKKSPVFILGWKDLYDNLEVILDACEDVADTVENICLKNF